MKTNSKSAESNGKRKLKGSAKASNEYRGNNDFPDPTVLSPEERTAQFGRLFLRAVERRAAKQPVD
ncbi:MAG: hypothetical protein H6822_30160 [Planctomycetaceae bacterium]|nr:hypothetical protein [Planctomycetales bacterium]MCB9926448.1 hypothetical protein [Planctomycetaceae bacterium]